MSMTVINVAIYLVRNKVHDFQEQQCKVHLSAMMRVIPHWIVGSVIMKECITKNKQNTLTLILDKKHKLILILLHKQTKSIIIILAVPKSADSPKIYWFQTFFNAASFRLLLHDFEIDLRSIPKPNVIIFLLQCPTH